MDINELEEAQNLIVPEKDRVSTHVAIFDPVTEVEQTLIHFFKSRLEKLEEDFVMVDSVKQAILSRLPEADFNDLARLLGMLQQNSTSSIDGMLSPFLRTMGEEEKASRKKSGTTTEAQIFNESSKDTLQSIAEFNKLVNKMVKNGQAEEIKKAIKE
jgi:glycyl-tRNA synthetase beta subunit